MGEASCAQKMVEDLGGLPTQDVSPKGKGILLLRGHEIPKSTAYGQNYCASHALPASLCAKVVHVRYDPEVHVFEV